MSNQENNNKSVLIPLEVRQIEFYDDEITAVLVETTDKGPQVYVPLRPISDYLGLAWSSQLQRVRRDPVLSEALSSVFIMNTEAGQRYEVICLHLDYVMGWLFGIDANRVRPELKDKIIRYRRECFQVLAQAFQSETAASINATATIKTDTSELVRIREMSLAMARMAQEQIELANRVDTHESRLNLAGAVVGGLMKRVSAIENQLAPPALISETQAEQISNRVKALAEYILKLDPKKKPPYGAIFSELYRRFGVSDYRHIRRNQFDQVMQFLNEWREAAGAGRLPDQLNMFGDE